jgi:hypothetical protein
MLALTWFHRVRMQALDRAGVLVADISASSGQVSLCYTVLHCTYDPAYCIGKSITLVRLLM